MRPLHRGLWLGGVLLLSPAVLSAGAGAQSRFKLRQTGFRVLYIGPVFITIEKGFFAEEGVDFSFTGISSGALGPATVLSGEAQVSDTDPLAAADLQREGKNMLLFYNLVKRVTLDLIVRNEVIQKTGVSRFSSLQRCFAVLKGLNIGITRPGAPTDVFPRYFLIKAGANPDRDANLIQVGGVPALAAAFRSGRIDTFVLSPPLPQTLEQEGIGKIIIRNTGGDVPEFRNLTYVGFFTSADYAKRNAAALKAYVKAIRKATAYIGSNKSDALKILGDKYFKDTPAETLALSLDALLPAISTDGTFTEAGIESYLNIFRTVGQSVTASSKEGGLWTNEFVR